VTRMLPFSKEKIIPRAYRHTYVICTPLSA
jgi:hypothetical protein